MENLNAVAASENGAAVAIEEFYTEDEREIWEEILDYSIWEFCIDVHRAVKLNYYVLDPDLDPNYNPDERNLTYNEEVEKNGQKSKKNNEFAAVDCPHCNKPTTSVVFGTHLPKCLGKGGRSNTREVNKKGTADGEDIEPEDNPNTSSGRNKGRKSRKRHNKKAQKTKAEAANSPRPSSENSPMPNNDDPENLTYEGKENSFNEEYSPLTEANESCINSDKFTEHTEEERETIQRSNLSELDDADSGEINTDSANSSEISADTTNNDEINADTASKDDSKYFDT